MGTIDPQHRRGARCGPPVLPDRRGHGGPCSVRRGRGSLLTGEEVGGEPPPAPAVPPISGRRAWPAWPPSGAPPSPPFHLRPAWPAVPRRRPVGIGGSVGRLLGCCPGGGVPLRRPRCCPSEKERGLGLPGALLGTFPAREKPHRVCPLRGRVVEHAFYTPGITANRKDRGANHSKAKSEVWKTLWKVPGDTRYCGGMPHHVQSVVLCVLQYKRG